MTLTTSTLGVVIRWQISVVLNMPTNYEVSSLHRSRDIQGIPKSPYLLTKFALRMRGIT